MNLIARLCSLILLLESSKRLKVHSNELLLTFLSDSLLAFISLQQLEMHITHCV